MCLLGGSLGLHSMNPTDFSRIAGSPRKWPERQSSTLLHSDNRQAQVLEGSYFAMGKVRRLSFVDSVRGGLQVSPPFRPRSLHSV